MIQKLTAAQIEEVRARRTRYYSVLMAVRDTLDRYQAENPPETQQPERIVLGRIFKKPVAA